MEIELKTAEWQCEYLNQGFKSKRKKKGAVGGGEERKWKLRNEEKDCGIEDSWPLGCGVDCCNDIGISIVGGIVSTRWYTM